MNRFQSTLLAVALVSAVASEPAEAQRLRRRTTDDATAQPGASVSAATVVSAPASPPPAEPAEPTSGGSRLRRRGAATPAEETPAAAPAPEAAASAAPTPVATIPADAASIVNAMSSDATEAGTAAEDFAPSSYGDLRPYGHAGSSPVVRSGDYDPNADFLPVEDRWRIGMPAYELWTRGHPTNPYEQNVIKGDYPIGGQNTFLNVTVVSDTVAEKKDVPTPSGSSTARPESKPFFGRGDTFFIKSDAIFGINVFHGNTAFKPVDWQLKITPVVNYNRLEVEEVGVVLPNVQRGTNRERDDFAIQEAFAELKILDQSWNFDFLSGRVGRQTFQSDFRAFLFADTNRGVRLFGNARDNRDQFNVAYFDMLEKDVNSELNTSEDRDQQVYIVNYYRQDTFHPGYNAQLSFHYNHDAGQLKYNENGFLVRPANIGTVDPVGSNALDAYYWGWTGDGHLGKTNVTHALYIARGDDQFNPLAGRSQDINAEMFAVELSEDHDWVRFKQQFLYASGDEDPRDGVAEGFDSILDNPNFAGGGFSFLVRQGVGLGGVNLFTPNSIFPNLRSNKFQGVANFVNPGLQLMGLGAEFELTPKMRLLMNGNYLRFDKTQSLEYLLNQAGINRSIGFDLSFGVTYRPDLNQNIILTGGFNTLMPLQGFKDIYESDSNLYSAFGSLTLTF